MMRKVIGFLFILAIAGFFVLRWLVQRVSPMPQNLGVVDGRFAPCPDSPNCVNTFASSDEHQISPIPMTTSLAAAKVKMYNVLVDMPRVTIIINGPDYIHAEFRSALWGFVDDVQIYFDDEAQLIHYKSAARLGYGDGGMNRKRMEAIRAAFLH